MAFACLGAASLFFAGSAEAEDSASAEALFNKGVADMEASHFDSACPAIAESQRLDPHAGTLFTLAECQAKWGKVASAVAYYQDYIGFVSRSPADQQARHAERVARATAAITRLKPSVPTLALSLPADAPPGTTVARDGVQLQGASLGLALPVDPGEHVIVTQVPGGPEHRVTVTLAPSDTKSLNVEIENAAPSGEASTPNQSATGVNAPPLETDARAKNRSRTTVAWVVGGAGVLGLGVGAVTGVMALGDASTTHKDCNGIDCSQAGKDAADRGKTLAIVSDIGFGVGIVGIAASAVLLYSARSSSAPPSDHATARWQPVIATDHRGTWAGLRGSF